MPPIPPEVADLDDVACCARRTAGTAKPVGTDLMEKQYDNRGRQYSSSNRLRNFIEVGALPTERRGFALTSHGEPHEIRRSVPEIERQPTAACR